MWITCLVFLTAINDTNCSLCVSCDWSRTGHSAHFWINLSVGAVARPTSSTQSVLDPDARLGHMNRKLKGIFLSACFQEQNQVSKHVRPNLQPSSVGLAPELRGGRKAKLSMSWANEHFVLKQELLFAPGMWRNHCICQWSFESHRFVVNRLQPSQHEAGSTVPYEHGRSGPISESKGHSYTDSTCNDISHVLSQIRCLQELLLQAAIAILPQQSSKPQHSASLWDTAGQFITVMCLDSGQVTPWPKCRQQTQIPAIPHSRGHSWKLQPVVSHPFADLGQMDAHTLASLGISTCWVPKHQDGTKDSKFTHAKIIHIIPTSSKYPSINMYVWIPLYCVYICIYIYMYMYIYNNVSSWLVSGPPPNVGTLGSIWRAMHATALELHLRQVGLRQRLKVGNNKLKKSNKNRSPGFFNYFN